MLALAGILAGIAGLTQPEGVPASAAVSADGGTGVVAARLGLHPDSTRFVLEVNAPISYRAAVLGTPYRVVVDLPDLAWQGGETPKSGMGVIRSYHLERPQAGSSRLVLDATGPVRIRGAMVMTPSEGHQTRLVLDFEAVSAAAFRPEPDHGTGSKPPPGEASARPFASAPALAPAPVAATPVVPTSAAFTPVAGAGPAAGPPQALLPPQLQPVPQPPSLNPATGSAPGPNPGPGQQPPVPQAFGAAASPPVPPVRAPLPRVLAEHEGQGAPQPGPGTQVAALAPPAAAAAMARPRPHRPVPTGKPVIALDPGHGGVDPGATGTTGIHEKDITLATAREVRRQLEATGRYRVFMTREEDEFVPLRERVARARQANAELFISLHADSIANSQIRGLSIYTLSDKASDHEAESLAAKENRSDAIGGIDLSNENDQVATILIDLAQRDTRNHSHHFAGLVLRDAGHTMPLLPKADRSAGFAVLTAPDVPSVLIEMGYLSNSDDVALLTQAEHRQRLAGSLVHAIDGYFGWLSGGRRL